jgi:hypothetical protein
MVFAHVDGATWTVLAPLLERGELPAFQRLREEGAFLPRFAALRITHSPVIWTTVATGRRTTASAASRRSCPTGRSSPSKFS